MEETEQEDYRFFGTPIEDQYENNARPSRQERPKDPEATRQLPIWKQEVTDEKGRRRFHGAFTGGFSAGYFNTVGSKEGWAPTTFRTSRAERATTHAQSIEQYLDEDELEEFKRKSLQANANYDTFGATAAEAARRAVKEESERRPSIIPGLVPEEAIVPVAQGIGIQLLQHMGWRQGKGIGSVTDRNTNVRHREDDGQSKNSKWSRVSGVGPENTPLHLIKPKHDTFGLGYDPFLGAEEFRAAKEEKKRVESGKRMGRQRGIAFGSGVLDEDDSYGILEDYVTHDTIESYDNVAGIDEEGMPLARGPLVHASRPGLGDKLALQGFAYEVVEQKLEGSDDDEEYDHHRRSKIPRLAYENSPRLTLTSAQQAKRQSFIPGFLVASGPSASTHFKTTFYPPPTIPVDYIPVHRMDESTNRKMTNQYLDTKFPVPLQRVPHPADPKLRTEIDRIAFFVAKNGPEFEHIARELQIKNKSTGDGRGFSFLLQGGDGADYYNFKVTALRSLLNLSYNKGIDSTNTRTIGQRSAPLTANDRGAILGEQPLPSDKKEPPSSLFEQANIVNNNAPKEGLLARSLLNVAKEDRERLAAVLRSTFVKAQTDQDAHDKQQQEIGDGAHGVGLRPGVSKNVSTAQGVSTGVAAPPPAPPPPHPRNQSASHTRGIITVHDLSRPFNQSEGVEKAIDVSKEYPLLPVRKTIEWRPEPLLCKRLDVPDPFQGRRSTSKQATQVLSRFKSDHIALPATAHALGKAAEAMAPTAVDFLLPPSLTVAAQEAAAAAELASCEVMNADNNIEEEIENREAKEAAKSFLSSLLVASEHDDNNGGGNADRKGSLGPGAEDFQGGVMSTPDDVGIDELALKKPIDLFKAIFEDSDEEEEKEENEDGNDDNQNGRVEDNEEAEQEKERNKNISHGVIERPSSTAGPNPVDTAMMARIEAALQVLKESKKRKKHRKEKKKRKKEEKRKKEKRSKKRGRSPRSNDNNDSTSLSDY